MGLLEAGAEGVVVAVHAQPGARRDEVVGRHGDALKVRVAAPAAGGQANAALAEVLADLFGCKPRQVRLVSGATSRQKRFEIAGTTLAEAEAALAALP